MPAQGRTMPGGGITVGEVKPKLGVCVAPPLSPSSGAVGSPGEGVGGSLDMFAAYSSDSWCAENDSR